MFNLALTAAPAPIFYRTATVVVVHPIDVVVHNLYVLEAALGLSGIQRLKSTITFTCILIGLCLYPLWLLCGWSQIGLAVRHLTLPIYISRRSNVERWITEVSAVDVAVAPTCAEETREWPVMLGCMLRRWCHLSSGYLCSTLLTIFCILVGSCHRSEIKSLWLLLFDFSFKSRDLLTEFVVYVITLFVIVTHNALCKRYLLLKYLPFFVRLLLLILGTLVQDLAVLEYPSLNRILSSLGCWTHAKHQDRLLSNSL